MTSMDPYVYPGTNVLRNLRDIRDPAQLSETESIATGRRIIELTGEPEPGTFDPRHLQSIHHYIFQDIYQWAGELRTGQHCASSFLCFPRTDHSGIGRV